MTTTEPEHVDYSLDVEDRAGTAEPEHTGFDGTEPEEPDADGADEPLSIVDEWGGDYPAGSSLFCAKFDADDFDHTWGEGDYSEGATVAIRRGEGPPPAGWILKNAHLSDEQRTKVMLEKFASRDALTVLYSLRSTVLDQFLDAWGKDGGMTPGKSNRSARRSANRRRR